MVFGIICLVLSIVAVIFCAICGRAADDSLAVPLFFSFLVLLIAGILSIAFDSTIVGIITIVVIAFWLIEQFFG